MAPPRGRGRGRGRYRGRGGSRGRVASRRRFSRKRSHTPDECEVAQNKETKPLDLDTDIKAFFRGTATFDDHYNAQGYNKDKYVAGLLLLNEMGIDVSQNARVRGLAAAWARHDHELAENLLSDNDNFGVAEVLKALTLLDSARLVRNTEKKMRLLENSKSIVTPQKMGKLKSDVDNLNAVKPNKGSVSGALSRHIKRWVRKFTKSELEFFALYFPKESWKKLADMCHLNPKEDFPELPWFLPFCFGADAPSDTMVQRCSTVTKDNVDSLLKEFEIPYAYLNKLKLKLNEESKAKVAQYTPLDTLLWYYEDIETPDVEAIIDKRLRHGDTVSLPIGKLLERLLMLTKKRIIKEPGWLRKTFSLDVDHQIAPFFPLLVEVTEPRLSEIKLELPSPIVIIGDRSGSMSVAINTSVIIASVLTAITSAELVFFNEKNMNAPFLPQTIQDVMKLTQMITAENCTKPAASLWPYYQKQQIVKTFIIVTDEEENTDYVDERTNTSYRFAPLFAKYHAEVYPARLVFVSFLQQHAKGIMVEDLKKHCPNITPMQFVFDGRKPDLTKLDTLFGLLSSECKDFEENLISKTNEVRELGLKKIFENLQLQKKNVNV